MITLNKDVQRFDQWAESYDSSWKQKKVFIPVQNKCIDTAVAAHMNPKAIADLGCGTGSLLRQAKTVWGEAELNGVDPAPKMIEVARKTTPSATFHTGYAEDLPFPRHSIELVFSTMSFHHWKNHAQSLREIHRVLKNNGYFILADVNPPRWVTWLSKDSKFWRGKERLRLFRSEGFEVKSQEKCLSGFALVTLAQKKE